MKRQFKPIKPGVNVTNHCCRCDQFYEGKDVIVLGEGVVCLNCLDTNDPQDIHEMLKAGFQQEGVLTIHNLQYGMIVMPE